MLKHSYKSSYRRTVYNYIKNVQDGYKHCNDDTKKKINQSNKNSFKKK